VLSRGEAVQIKGELFVLGIDYTVHRLHGNPTVGVK
jgi:hypothetical protein